MFEFLKIFSRPKRPHTPIITPKPEHVAVIMDGNGRWANAQGLSRVAGHKQGIDSVKGLIRGCLNHEISHLTIFAFSSENWNRPANEVNALMELLSNALETQTKKLNENGVCLRLIGDLGKFSAKIQTLAERAQAETAANTRLIFTVAVNYGGRWDIAQANRAIARKVAAGKINPEDIDEDTVAAHLSTHDMPDPDLFIRTSGEYRISNFMLWQAAYSEFCFVDTLWPDFDEDAFTQTLLKYTRRDRRYGGAKDAVPDGAVEKLTVLSGSDEGSLPENERDSQERDHPSQENEDAQAEIRRHA